MKMATEPEREGETEREGEQGRERESEKAVHDRWQRVKVKDIGKLGLRQRLGQLKKGMLNN